MAGFKRENGMKTIENLNGGLPHVHNLKSEPAAIEVRCLSAFYAPPICET